MHMPPLGNPPRMHFWLQSDEHGSMQMGSGYSAAIGSNMNTITSRILATWGDKRIKIKYDMD